MTFSTEVWASILKTWLAFVAYNLDKLHDVDVITVDLMGYLYKTSIEYGGRRLSCVQFMEKLVIPFLELFQKTSVKTIVFCLDPINNSRPEKIKAAIARKNAQKKKEEEEKAPRYLEPTSDGRYFDFDLPFPGSIDLIFKTPAAKERFIFFIEDYFLTENVRKKIPKGRSIILSGTVEPNPEAPSSSTHFPLDKYSYKNNAPTFISSYYDKDEIECRKMPEHLFETVSEADCDVVRWILAFPAYQKFAAFSHDRDIFVILLLAMTRILSVNKDRQCFYCTKAVLDDMPMISEEAKTQKLRALQEKRYQKKEQFQSLVASGSTEEQAYVQVGGYGLKTLSKPVVVRNQRPSVDQCIDVTGMYVEMCREAIAVSKCHCPHVGTCRKGHVVSPIELYAVGMCISTKSHDYLTGDLMAGIGPMIIWVKFIENIYLLRNLVQATYDPNTGSLRYGIHWQVLKKCVDICSHGKFGLSENKKFPSDEKIRVYAARLSWYLNYIGNGVDPNVQVQSGLAVDDNTGLSLYGYAQGALVDEVHKPTKPVYHAPVIEKRKSTRIKRTRRT